MQEPPCYQCIGRPRCCNKTNVHCDIIFEYFLRLEEDDNRKRWIIVRKYLPKLLSIHRS